MIKWLNAVSPTNMTDVGAKAVNLAHLINCGQLVPNGFCITTSAYHRFVQTNHLDDMLGISRFVGSTESELIGYCQNAQASILRSRIPEDVASAILTAYQQLQHDSVGELPSLAVRSSSTVEDLDKASFSGIFETFL